MQSVLGNKEMVSRKWSVLKQAEEKKSRRALEEKLCVGEIEQLEESCHAIFTVDKRRFCATP
jgi:hypothetical protein